MDGMTLVANIIPRIDKEAFKKELTSVFSDVINVNVNAGQGAYQVGAGQGQTSTGSGTGAGAPGSGTRSNAGSITPGLDNSSDLQNIENQNAYYNAANSADNTSRFLKGFNKALKNLMVQEDDDEATATKKQSRQLGIIAGATSQLAGAGISLMKNSFGILEEIYGKLKASSPLLQTIESLFNLAMTLFFMPLGNKLAEVLLPATLNLVDAVVDMWDSFGDMTLSEMFTTALEYGVGLLSDYLNNIGTLLSEQGGLLGSIGDLILSLSDFIENNGLNLLESIFTIVGFVVEHLKMIISLVSAFYAMQVAANIAQMYVTATGSTIGGWFGAGVLAAGIGTAAITYAGLSAIGLAEGGYVPAKDGGTLAVIGEGGEGEYVIPESKVGGMGGSTYNINIYGMTDNDLKSYINDVVSEQISQSRLRSGF